MSLSSKSAPKASRLGSKGSVHSAAVMSLLMMSKSKTLRKYLQGMEGSLFKSYDERQIEFEKFCPEQLTEDLYALLKVAGVDLFFNSPPEQLEVEEPHVPDEKDRPTGLDNTKPPPEHWPFGVSKGLEKVFHPAVSLLPGFEDEREEEMPFYTEHEEVQDKPWTLQDLGMEAMQGVFQRQDDKFNTFLNARFIPKQIKHRFQELLPLDIPVFKAILAIDEGVFWERLIKKTYPYIYPSPKLQRTTYKSIYLQEWFADYLGNLEPGYISYNQVKKTALAVAMWIFELDIKGLKPPKFIKTETPKRNMTEDEWNAIKKETCLIVDPYPRRLELKEVIRCLYNLRHLSICFGFENYERNHIFSYARINRDDIQSLGSGLNLCSRLVSLRIHKSAFYSQDLIVLANSIIFVPIKKLEISNCLLDNEGALAAAQLIKKHKFLEVLDLKRNHIGEIGAYYLAMALIEKDITPLRYLNLSFNAIGDIGALYLSLMLAVNVTLGDLVLSACGINSAGARALGSGLYCNHSLLVLRLDGNKLDNKSGESLKRGMENHPKIEEVEVRLSGLSTDLENKIFEIGKEHKSTNRRYFIVKDYLKRKDECSKYVLAEGEKKNITSKPFPSYGCPGEDDSGSSTESAITEICQYDQHPILSRYRKEFDGKNKKKEAKQTYLKYLHHKMKKEVKKGIKEIYHKGSPLLKLMNTDIKGELPHDLMFKY